MNSLTYMLDVHKYYDLLKEENIILSHKGALDGDLIDIIVQLVDKRLFKSKTRTRIKKKVINILVECLQNSFHYTTTFEDDKEQCTLVESPFLILSKHENSYIIFTGNYVTSDRAEHLKERIELVSQLSNKELQEYYIKSLNKDTLPQEGGAGLGLVDIIRRSKHNVSFDFKEVDEVHILFSLLVKIT